MAIKLLKKSEISALKSQEKRAEIDQGKQLAAKVDRLREIAAEEERSLADFRVKAVAAINTEITKLTSQKSELEKKIASLNEDRAAGMTVVNAKLAELEAEKLQVAKLENDYRIMLREVADSNEKAKAAEQRWLKNQEISYDMLAQAKKREAYLKNQMVKFNARNQVLVDRENAINVLRDQASKEIYTKNADLAARERDLIHKIEYINKKEKALHEREIQLRDRELTLEREFNRLKK